MNGYWWKMALTSFIGALVMALSVFVAIAASIHYSVPNLLGLTSQAGSALACCKTAFSWCLVSPTMFMTITPWLGFGIVTTGLVVAIFRAIRNLIISRRFLSALNVSAPGNIPNLKHIAPNSNIPIVPFNDKWFNSAFTLGLFKPKVYISTALIKELTQGECEAVILHELHHAEAKDPLKLFVLSFIKDVFFFLPLGHYLTNLFCRTKELAADEKAVSETGRPLDLAQALVKMLKMKQETIPVGVPILDKPSIIEKRIKELLEPEAGKKSEGPRTAVILTTIAALFVMLLAMAAPIYAGGRPMEKCNHNYCKSPASSCPAHTGVSKDKCDLPEH
ncbi:hypothetical protein MNBD_NITROSPINAE01-1325 [hydrothermal vent metagenome]|uniref:Peptidase M56 domain-containing protein n=1 Tax=hydrothermal vent metagenome TaxID=652676 RepID=A0A3B1CP53_9ZZZZ